MVEVIDSARGLAQWLWEQFETWQGQGHDERERTVTGFANAHGSNTGTLNRIFGGDSYGKSNIWDKILGTMGKELYVRVDGSVYTDWREALQTLQRHPRAEWSPDQIHDLWRMRARDKEYVMSNMEKTMRDLGVPFCWVITDKE